MNLKEYPQYKLFKFTSLLNEKKRQFQNPDTGERAVNSTIISRAYYSAYSYTCLWLEDQHDFKFKQKWEFKEEGKEYISEHAQVRIKLEELNCFKVKDNLYELFKLREKADYSMNIPLTEKNIKESLYHMELIFNELKF